MTPAVSGNPYDGPSSIPPPRSSAYVDYCACCGTLSPDLQTVEICTPCLQNHARTHDAATWLNPSPRRVRRGWTRLAELILTLAIAWAIAILAAIGLYNVLR